MEQDVEVMVRQMKALRNDVRDLAELVRTVSSPPPARLWWFLQGYRWSRIGRWYGKTEELR